MVGALREVPVIGLIGGVGSGKSFVTRGLAARRPVEVIVADQIGHDALKLPEVKDEIRRFFGEGVFGADGEIDRPKMSDRVFGTDAAAQSRRSVLESIVHPRITAEVDRRIEQSRRRKDLAAILVDAPLLLEAGWHTLCDHVVFVDCPRETRLERVMNNRGWSAAELDRREASQWTLEAKLAAANLVVDNSEHGHAVDELERYLDEIHP